jgi:AcrR family transcriptional regulator
MLGLRERKKQQTRELLYETAWRMFAARGFDRVTVAEVATQAQVSLATVFNYFPTKEDLLYGRLEAHGTRLVEAVAARQPGESVLVAFRRHLDSAGGLLAKAEAGDSAALDQVRTFNRLIAGSGALQARERLALSRTAEALAALLATENDRPADDVGARAVANALIGVQHVLIDYVRKRLLADDDPTEIARGLRQASDEAFALLAHGLDDYPRTTGQTRSSRRRPCGSA